MTTTLDTAQTPSQDTRCMLLYYVMREDENGVIELGESTLFGDEDADKKLEYCVFDSAEDAIDSFMDNLRAGEVPSGIDVDDPQLETLTVAELTEKYGGEDTMVRVEATIGGEKYTSLYCLAAYTQTEWIDAFRETWAEWASGH